jgi:polyhydroxyalkanoate synthesis regulator phasin
MKKLIGLVVAGAVLLTAVPSGWAASTEVDALIQKLVEKGVLTKEEGNDIKQEIAKDSKTFQEDRINQTMPDWVKNTKLKGDLRVRYQYERRENDTEARSRGRIRYRLGLENKVNDQWKVGAGLASAEVGSTTDDARSTNQTFTDNFRRGDIRLDYAFAEYQPAPWGKAVAGRFIKNDYLWTPTDLLWDTDINPTGGSVHLEKKFSETATAYANSGVWVIDENGKVDRPDPFLFYSQAGLKNKMGVFDSNIAGIYYGFNGVKGTTLDGTASTNTLSGGVLQHDYDSIGASAEFGLKNPLALESVERLALFGDYITNLDPEADENGWAAGIKFGDAKVNGKNQWQIKYQYSSLQKDAFPDAYPDSDRLGGITDMQGHEWILEYGLSKNVILGLDYYQDDRISAASNHQKLLQADVNFKF